MAPVNADHDGLDHSGQYAPGSGARNPNNINNKGFFALFALLGVAIVITSIWFFFWAKNGGFHWRKGDWDDYKSTVLRRKGPDGKTLSNATPRTNLGQKSIAGTFDIERDSEMRETKHKKYRDAPRKERNSGKGPERHGGERKSQHSFPKDSVDNDVREYRRERPARVGGLNRNHDGSHFDYSNTDRSDIMSRSDISHNHSEVSNNSRTHLRPSPRKADAPKKKKGFLEKQREKKQEKQKRKNDTTKSTPTPARQPRRYSFTTVDTQTVADSADMQGSNRDSTYYGEYRPRASPARTPQRRSHPAGNSRPAPPRAMPRTPGTFDAYSEAGTSDTGTKSYTHHIPALSRGAPTVSAGFRRGGATTGRRDSLSDSD